ncbi:MAG TPA: ribosome maturation factor RimP, partial [Candidatus Sulfotelmatobacter sp.]|nr:ribosome maturation factor RimP [Candidatus Sulfotelmatobacter sp.]
DRMAELVRPSLEHLGLDLCSLQWVGAGGRGRGAILRLVIDKRGGVTLDDCERVSGAVGAVLDAYDPIDVPYQLEVSSPGAERPLRELEEWRASVGRRVNVRFSLGESETVVEGRLISVAGDRIEVESPVGRNRKRVTAIPTEAITAGRIAVDI